MKHFTKLIIFVLVLISPIVIFSATINVPGDSTTIQAGIDGALDGDTVLVSDNTYTGDGNRDIDFGGKAIVLISENGSEYTVIDCQGDSLDPHRGFIFHSKEDTFSVLDGFTIQNGYAPGYPAIHPTLGAVTAYMGAGILCADTSSPKIINCIFSGNITTLNSLDGVEGGGGMECYNLSSPQIVNCSFTNNLSNWGSGLEIWSSSPSVINCNFISNIAGNETVYQAGGAGLAIWFGSNPTISTCTLIANRATSQDFEPVGGGILFWDCFGELSNCSFIANRSIHIGSMSYGGGLAGIYCSLSVTNCNFSNDTADIGSGLMLYDSWVQLDSCTVSENYASIAGGGMAVMQSDEVSRISSFLNCVINENKAGIKGGGLYTARYPSLTISNCTFSSNTADSAGSGVYSNDMEPVIEKCIIAYGSQSEVVSCESSGRGNSIDPINGVGGFFLIKTTGFQKASYSRPKGIQLSETIDFIGTDSYFGSGIPVFNCCNIYGNDSGDWIGCIADQIGINDNFSRNPLFCDTAIGNFHIDSLSPCASDNNNCGALIGALDPQCKNCNDFDNDGICYVDDNCPEVSNPGQEDSDEDSRGDSCDVCPGYVDSLDADFDSVPDDCDNCPTVSNAGQNDYDEDDIGDICDDCTDTDEDGFGDPGFPYNTCADDNCPSIYDPSQVDSDGDGVGDICEDFVCGDADNSNQTDIGDWTFLRQYLYESGPAPANIYAADFDSVNGISNNDIQFMTYNFFYYQTTFYCPPFPDSVLPVSNDTIEIRNSIVLPSEEVCNVKLLLNASDSIWAFSLPFSFDCATSEITCDSIDLSNSLFEDASIYFDWQVDNDNSIGLIAAADRYTVNMVPSGSYGTLASLWFTVSPSSDTQFVVIDTTIYPPSNVIVFSKVDSNRVRAFIPEIVTYSVCIDSDYDGFGDPGHPENDCPDDNCPQVSNPYQDDFDADGFGDVCDNCPSVSNSDQSDIDNDESGDPCDNCPDDSNQDQANSDSDSFGDACDNCPNVDNEDQTDLDTDGHGDICDNCPSISNEDQFDTDEDGIGDVCDDCTDTDGDGYGNPEFPINTCPDDNCPYSYNPSQDDSDGDGIGDICDKDSVYLFVNDGQDTTGIKNFEFVIQIKLSTVDTITGGNLGFTWIDDIYDFLNLDTVVFGPKLEQWGIHEFTELDSANYYAFISIGGAAFPEDPYLMPDSIYLWAELYFELTDSLRPWPVDTQVIFDSSFVPPGGTFTIVHIGDIESTPCIGPPLVLYPADSDSDYVADLWDNCPDVYNPGQEDLNDNGIGDACEATCCEIAGDANHNGIVNILDITFLISYLYKSGPEPPCMAEGDANGNDTVNLLDITYLISYLYKYGPEPVCATVD